MNTPRWMIDAPRFLVVAALALGLPRLASGQDDDSLAKIQHFEGGQLALTMGATSVALLGPGVAGLQTTVAPIYPGPGRQLHNPALLGLVGRPLLSADLGPRLGLDLGGMLGLDDELVSRTDDLLEDHLADGGTLVASTADASVFHPGGLGTAALILPLPAGTASFTIDAPFALDLDLLATGLQAWADIEKTLGDQTETVLLRADLDLSARLRLRARRYSVAMGLRPLPDLSVGVGVDWLAYRAQVDGLADTEGIMSTGGREFSFGDPNDAWENSLDQSVHGDYAGHGWTLRLGAGWRPVPRLALGLVLQASPPVELPGSAELSLRRLVAYADGGIDPAQLSLSQPTRTEAVDSPVDDRFRLALPGSLGLGAASFLGPVSLSLDGSLFWGDGSLRYLDTELALRPRGLLKAGVYSGPASLSLGVLLASPRVVFDGETHASGLLPLPMLTLGGGARVGERLRLDAMLSAAPLPSLRLSGTLLL